MINEATLAESIRRLRQGERATLAQAMTLVESRHPRHQALSTQLLDAIMPYCGNALRLGVTGTPGAGKSTFLEAFGMLLIREGVPKRRLFARYHPPVIWAVPVSERGN